MAAATTKTNPELEAVIEANPDEPDGYFVYGDWLTTEGDPRGELIALQATLLRRPNDKALPKAISKHIATNKEELLGELTKYHGDKLDLTWRLGFLRSARIHVDRKDMKKAIETLLNHPSSRFLERLSIANPGSYESASVTSKEWVDVLLELKKPKTLKDLFLGAAWDIEREPRAEELKKTFPRLERSVASQWRSIMETVAAQRKIEPNFDPEKMPALEALDGVDVGEIDYARLLVGLRLEIDKKRDLGLVAAMRRAFTTESLDQFVIDGFAKQLGPRGDPSTKTKWGFQAIGLLGDDGAASWIADHWGDWSHARVVQAAEMLHNMTSPLAIYELYGMTIDLALNRPRRNEGRALLENVAKRRSIPLDELLDRSVPAIAPSVDSRDRADIATRRRLEHHMVEGRRMSMGHFRYYFSNHPLVAPHARKVVWACYDRKSSRGAKADANVTHTFRIDAASAMPVDQAGNPLGIETAAAANVGVLHPLDLADDQRAEVLRAWRAVFKKEKIAQPFLQLDRPTFELREQEQGDTIGRFVRRRAGFDRMREVMESERDWAVTDQHDQGGTAAWGKLFRRDGVHVTAILGDYGGTIEELQARRMEDGGSRMSFRELSPVTISEILYDTETATTPLPTTVKEAAKKSAEIGDTAGVKKGERVRIGIRGGEGRGKWGIVIWVGERAGVLRCGVRADDGETYWTEINALEALSDEDRAQDKASSKKREAQQAAVKEEVEAKLQKGMRVSWKHGGHSGTGVIFWLGEGKFGGGPRAGIKDDANGETVWADASLCEPLESQGKPGAPANAKPPKPVKKPKDDDDDDTYDDIDE